MSTVRQCLAPDRLTETEQKMVALAERGLSPAGMRDHFPTFQLDSIKKRCRELRKRGYNIPQGNVRAYKTGPREQTADQIIRASQDHITDLKKAGYTVFLYQLWCEYRIRPGKLDRALAPPLNYSAMGSPAAMAAAS